MYGQSGDRQPLLPHLHRRPNRSARRRRFRPALAPSRNRRPIQGRRRFTQHRTLRKNLHASTTRPDPETPPPPPSSSSTAAGSASTLPSPPATMTTWPPSPPKQTPSFCLCTTGGRRSTSSPSPSAMHGKLSAGPRPIMAETGLRPGSTTMRISVGFSWSEPALEPPWPTTPSDSREWMGLSGDPILGPEKDPDLGRLGSGKELIFVAEKDFLRERGWGYHKALKESEWDGDVEIGETEGERHCFHLIDPTSPKALALMKKLTHFSLLYLFSLFCALRPATPGTKTSPSQRVRDAGDEDVTVMKSSRQRRYLEEIATPMGTFGGWCDFDCREISRRTVILCHPTIANLQLWPRDDGRQERESTSLATNPARNRLPSRSLE
ncbi:hypothetical protein TIFTF001_006923 [Ficus carica]|uniref:Uncharacterized protein n=1 Tax=Ficus carica TaxID=3494 RepID=A0AA88D0B8_FICCA|nr:hypothetical protein TIFTF001_006923 [Ficus carica]